MAAGAFAALLAGCFPVPLGHYYKPIVADGHPRYSGNECRGATGAPVTMTLDLADGVVLSLSTREAAGGEGDPGLRMSIGMTVPDGARVRWTEAAFSVREPGGPVRKFEPRWSVSGAKRLPSSGSVEWRRLAAVPELFAQGAPVPTGFLGRLSASVTWADFRPPAMTVTLPGYEIDRSAEAGGSTTAVVAPTSFELGSHDPADPTRSGRSTFYRTEELERAHANFIAQCDAEHVAKRVYSCGELADMRHDTFRLLHGAIRVEGRWWIYERERGSPLQGNLSFEMRSPVSVEWQDTHVLFRARDDASSVGRRSIEIKDFLASSRFEAPLTAEVVGVNEPSPIASTTASFVVNLGTSHPPRYRVELPPVLINGKPFAQQPVELESRRFDVGLSPFNC